MNNPFLEAMRLRQKLVNTLPKRDGEEAVVLTESISGDPGFRRMTDAVTKIMSENGPAARTYREQIDMNDPLVVESIVVDEAMDMDDIPFKGDEPDSPTAEVKITVPKNKRIEGYGVKGMKSTPWRKVFKNAEALNQWIERNDAECHGTREAEVDAKIGSVK